MSTSVPYDLRPDVDRATRALALAVIDRNSPDAPAGWDLCTTGECPSRKGARGIPHLGPEVVELLGDNALWQFRTSIFVDDGGSRSRPTRHFARPHPYDDHAIEERKRKYFAFADNTFGNDRTLEQEHLDAAAQLEPTGGLAPHSLQDFSKPGRPQAGPSHSVDASGTQDEYPNRAWVSYIIARPSLSAGGGPPSDANPNGDESVQFCSGSFVDGSHVLTAAHCVVGSMVKHAEDAADPFQFGWYWANRDNPYAAPDAHETIHGEDSGRGYVCFGGDVSGVRAFGTRCAFVSKRSVPTSYLTRGSNESVADDIAMLFLDDTGHPQGLGAEQYSMLTSISSAKSLEKVRGVTRGYPDLKPGPALTDPPEGTPPCGPANLAQNWRVTQQGAWYMQWANQRHTAGAVNVYHGQKPNSFFHFDGWTYSGCSGSAIYHFSDEGEWYTDHQAFRTIGVISHESGAEDPDSCYAHTNNPAPWNIVPFITAWLGA